MMDNQSGRNMNDFPGATKPHAGTGMVDVMVWWSGAVVSGP